MCTHNILIFVLSVLYKSYRRSIMELIHQPQTAQKITKRDGRRVKFYPHFIYQSIIKAMGANINKEVANIIAQNALNQVNELKTTKAIHQFVILSLKHYKQYQTALNYENFHTKQFKDREDQLDIKKKITQLTSGNRKMLNENANKDSRVFNTMRDLTAGTSAKAIGLNLLPKEVANAHLKGDIHFHDLDYSPYSPMTNCCLIDVKYMMDHGFQIGNAEVDSPKSINTAAAQIAQIIANVASSQFGGCTIDRIDEILAPYAELNFKKHLKTAQEWFPESDIIEEYAKSRTQKDIYDAMQSLEYEINTLYTSNGQTPFTTVGFGLGTNWYEREIQKAILNIRIQGLGKEKRTAIFPKLVFTLRKGTNLQPTDVNYDIKQLAIECATKRMYPDVLMYDKILELTGSFKAPMGCRSFLQGWHNEAGEEVNAGRMNLGVVTLNVPRIALESNQSPKIFWQLMDERLQVIKTALLYRIKRTKEAVPANAPILYQHGAFGHHLSENDEVDTVFKNRRATISIGYIGLYEATAYYFGRNWENNPTAKAFSLEIVKKLKEAADEWADEYGYHFSVYSTPAESLTDRFCHLDQEKFGLIEDITDKDYYTNSFHYDVRKSPTPFEKIEFEKDYPKYCSGGFIHYCEYPNMVQNPKALETVWDFAYDRIGYLGTNTPIDHCYECDFDGDFEPTERGFKCPQCGNTNPDTCDVVKRTCGYLGNPNIRPMIHGRHEEIASRKKHMGASK